MKGIDTNVLVRYLVKDDARHAKEAASCISAIAASGETCFLSHLVLCELVWVLESAYGYTRKEIAATLEKILAARQFEIEDSDIAHQAVHDYKTDRGDLADYLIGRTNRSRGCDTTYTFDRALKGSMLFSLL